MKTQCLLTLMLLVRLAAPSGVLAQTGNGQVSGIVQDSSKALLPGVTVTLGNIETGIESTQISNATGAYTFASVPPGAYKLKAHLENFKQSVVNDLKVGANAQVRWDFTLEIGDVTQQVEVASPPDAALTESSASVGVVLTEKRVTELPLVGQNVLDLLRVLPGYRPGLFANTSTVGGLGLDVMNTTINGVSTNSARDSASLWGPQVLTTNVINPDLVSEIRLILAPVDAELGRGNSQVQIQTRSGTNKLGGTFTWNVQNSATDANTWDRNRLGQQPDWYNLNQLTGSLGGPIVKNKTFFYFLYDRQLVNRRELVTSQVLTDTARQGIFRYWSGWNPGDALTPAPQSFVSGGATPTGTWAAVDFNGNPVAPLKNPDGTPYTGGLMCFSLFGNVKIDGTAFTQQDCPGGTAVIRSTPWDTFRQTPDTTGYIKRIIDIMPHANGYARTGGLTPDGLNTAIYQWVAHRKGPSGSSLFGNAIIGVVQNPGDYNNRSQSNIKIDHNINARHRLSVNWTYEADDGDGSLPAWGGPLKGLVRRRPQFLSISGTSVLGPSMVNEARFGVNYSRERGSPAWANPKEADATALARTFLLQGGTNPANGVTYPILLNPGPAAAFGSTPANTYSGFMNFNSFDFANTTPLWDYADTLRWSRDKHSFSIGVEYRRPTTTGYTNSAYATSGIGAGPAATSPLISANTTNFAAELPGFLLTARQNTASLLYFMNGSIVAGNCPAFFSPATCTSYWIDGYDDVAAGQWQNVTTATDTVSTADPYGHQNRTQIQNEWSFFVKDDFKVAPRLTLNLGLRYDFAGSPYLKGGLTNRLVGDGEGLFGAGRPASGNIFDGWLTPGDLYLTGYGSSTTTPLSCQTGVQQSPMLPVSNCDPGLASTIEFVGPGSPNPEKTLVPQRGQLGPAIGFAWRIPWFGDRTTMRGGYQRTYGRAGAAFTGGLLSGPGGDVSASGIDTTAASAILATRALNLTDLPMLIPAAPTRQPGVSIPMAGRSVAISYSMYDKDYRTPYTDNLTLSIQRELTRNLSVELRYVNTVGRAQPGTLGGGFVISAPGSVDINTVNVYHNPELFQALENTRAGLDDPLFDQMFMGLNLNPFVPGYGPVGTVVNGVLQRGSAHLRRSTAASFFGPTVSSALANGNYAGVIQALLPIAAGFNLQPLPLDPKTGAPVAASQRVLRNGCDRIANGLTAGFMLSDGTQILPRCFPENYFIANPQLSTANYAANYGKTNYNAFEAQFTLRPVYGITLQGAYGFSKTMELPGSGYTDPLNRQMDYRESIQSVGHDFRANGIIELPIGPNKFFLGRSGGWLARALEHWQTGFILEMAQGAPRTFLTNNNMLYANGRPDVVGPWNNPKGNVAWNGQTGSFFGDPNPYATFADPQCAQRVGSTDQNGFNLRSQCSLLGLAMVVPEGTPGAIPVSQGRFGIPVLQNPLPGHQGTLGANTMNTHGRWRFDANLSKAFQLTERESLQVRIDAINVLNHPEPGDPAGLSGFGSSFTDNFGQITTKSGSRSFQGKLRLVF
ncbi:MAG TPA: TonB-dependent receptor [Terriglobia bacterium]|nr:TonB-dependent receptor [Terriglobia bacterium]